MWLGAGEDRQAEGRQSPSPLCRLPLLGAQLTSHGGCCVPSGFCRPLGDSCNQGGGGER